MKSHSNCVICNSPDYNIIFRENEAQHQQIVKCQSCNLIYAHPKKKDASIQKSKIRQFVSPLSEDEERVQKLYNKMSDYRKIHKHISNIKPNKGKLLDIGSSIGHFVNMFDKQGWEVEGLEPNYRYVAFAKEKYGLDLTPATLESFNFENDSFDVVTMLHVIEHLVDPDLCLSRIYKILKPDGVLVIETPTYDTLLFKILGKRERNLSCNSHIYFFTLNTLIRLLSKNNFRIIKKNRVGRTLSAEKLLLVLRQIHRRTSVDGFLKTFSRFFHLHKIKVYVNVGNILRAYCEKM